MKDSDTGITQQRLSKNLRGFLGYDRLNHFAQMVRPGGMGSFLGVIVIALLTLSGCTDGENTPVPSDGASSSQTSATGIATATAEPSVTPQPAYKPATDQGPAENVPIPVMPEKAKEFSKEGLIAFTEYWYQTLGYAFETGNPEPMMAISDPGCKTCGAMKEAVIGGHAEGKWIKGGKMVIDPPRSAFVKIADGTYQALTMARQENVMYFKADGTLSKDLGVTIAQRDILVGKYHDGAWIAITVEHTAGSKSS